MRYAHFLYTIAIIALLLVFGGPVLYGASRWIDFGIFKVQPSEIAKWTTMIMGASILARSKVGSMQDSLRGIAKVGLCFSLPMFLIFLQPDLGSTLVFPPIAFSLLTLRLFVQLAGYIRLIVDPKLQPIGVPLIVDVENQAKQEASQLDNIK